MLYKKSRDTMKGNRDPSNILLTADDYNENDSQYLSSSHTANTRPINMILPEGIRLPLSIDTTTPCRLCIGTEGNCKSEFIVEIEAMLTKIPGFFFMSYRQIAFFN